jgi:8-oxo-dGTP pyrophosphatase MutT (NUDIX family)
MTSGGIRSTLYALLPRVMHKYWRFSRGLTVGVRAVVIDQAGRVFLVRHHYAPGWHLPGGGVEPGETLLDALTRELAEEGNIELLAAPALHGIFYHPMYSRRDHIAIYVVREFSQDSMPAPNLEIAELGFFAPNALPSGTTSATAARIDEVLYGKPPAQRW